MYDVIIIGGGAAGMTAAMYASRGGMKTLVFEKISCGGQALKTPDIDNYPGFYNSPSGAELSGAIEKHAKKFGAEFLQETVKSVRNNADGTKTVSTRKNEYHSKTVIFATGAEPKKAGIDGEDRFIGAGVSYCAFCDGAFFKDKDVVVIGGGNTAFENALYLSNFCNNVFVLNRSKKFRAQKILVERAKSNPKITIYTDMITEKIEGGTSVERIYSRNTVTGEMGFIKADGVFVAVGVKPESVIAKACGIETCDRGFIKTDLYLETNIKGIYAAGDARVTPLRQVITAAADGAVAASSAINYVNSLEL